MELIISSDSSTTVLQTTYRNHLVTPSDSLPVSTGYVDGVQANEALNCERKSEKWDAHDRNWEKF